MRKSTVHKASANPTIIVRPHLRENDRLYVLPVIRGEWGEYVWVVDRTDGRLEVYHAQTDTKPWLTLEPAMQEFFIPIYAARGT
jgi:hypothetical protein